MLNSSINTKIPNSELKGSTSHCVRAYRVQQDYSLTIVYQVITFQGLPVINICQKQERSKTRKWRKSKAHCHRASSHDEDGNYCNTLSGVFILKPQSDNLPVNLFFITPLAILCLKTRLKFKIHNSEPYIFIESIVYISTAHLNAPHYKHYILRVWVYVYL